MRYFPALAALALASTLGACSQEQKTTATTEAAPATSTATPSGPAAAPALAASKVLGLEGLGDLRIGAPPPTSGSWAERGAQASDGCRTLTSPAYPGVYAMVTGGEVKRITVGQRSDVKLAEGIGVGASEADVQKWFAGFRGEPHKYESAPAKYLTAPNAASGDPALRFEIGTNGQVSLIHIGVMPELAFVEGCS